MKNRRHSKCFAVLIYVYIMCGYCTSHYGTMNTENKNNKVPESKASTKQHGCKQYSNMK